MVVKYVNAAGRTSMQLGRGMDTTTGSPLGVAVVPDEAKVDPNNSGQIVKYDITIIESSSEFEDSLGLSIGAELRYGLFSATGKFEFRETSAYKDSATYVLAKCDVTNPPIGLFDPSAKPEAKQYVDKGDAFRRAYGDGFIRAAITGGEFYLLMEIVHEDTSFQSAIAASIAADYNGLVTGAKLNASLSMETNEKISKSQFRLVQYQASGVGAKTQNVNEHVQSVMERLKAFPQIVLDDPIALQVEVASYDTIPSLQANLEARSALRAALDDCARKKLDYKQVIDELDFLLSAGNRKYFVDPPHDDIAQSWKRQYTKAWNAVTRYAIDLVEPGTPPEMFVEPEELEVVRLQRSHPSLEDAVVAVPHLEGLAPEEAKRQLEQVGLVPAPKARGVDASDQTRRGEVLSQSPTAGEPVKKGASVRYEYVFTHIGIVKKFDALQLGSALNAVGIAR